MSVAEFRADVDRALAIEKILRDYLVPLRDGAYKEATREIAATYQQKEADDRCATELFAAAFQALTMRCMGYDDEIKALRRDVRALQERATCTQ